jgi:hypothetical protein
VGHDLFHRGGRGGEGILLGGGGGGRFDPELLERLAKGISVGSRRGQ